MCVSILCSIRSLQKAGINPTALTRKQDKEVPYPIVSGQFVHGTDLCAKYAYF